MTTALAHNQPTAITGLDDQTMQNLISGGDCSRLSPAQKTAYYVARCEAAGLDPRAQPFAFMRLNGKEVLYAQKAASDQLAAKHGVRLTIVSQATEGDIRVVTVRAEARDGRATEEIGALPIKGLTGEALSNALMKCVTKAKRRAVLSLCGLGMLDEAEVESIPQAAPVAPQSTRPVPEPVAAAAQVLDAKVVETKPAPAKPPPAYVAALWKRCRDEYGDAAKDEWAEAAVKALGENHPPSSEWTPEQVELVKAKLFGDIRF